MNNKKNQPLTTDDTLVEVKTIPKLADLNLSNNFLFGEVMYDEQTAKDVLEIILGMAIEKVIIIHKEHQIDQKHNRKGIRMDVYLKDAKNTVYNIEMQVERFYNEPKRSRYYQSMIDTTLLKKGIKNYNKLNNSFIIFICLFDPFGLKRGCYTFEERCIEEPSLALGDGTRKVFLNTDHDEQNIRPELRDFLNFVKDSVTNITYHDERMQRLANRVEQIKKDADVEVSYMFYEILEQEREERAIERGMAKGMAKGIAESIVDLLADYEDVPNWLESQIMCETSLDRLKLWLKIAAHVETIDAFLEKTRITKA